MPLLHAIIPTAGVRIDTNNLMKASLELVIGSSTTGFGNLLAVCTGHHRLSYNTSLSMPNSKRPSLALNALHKAIKLINRKDWKGVG